MYLICTFVVYNTCNFFLVIFDVLFSCQIYSHITHNLIFFPFIFLLFHCFMCTGVWMCIVVYSNGLIIMSCNELVFEDIHNSWLYCFTNPLETI